jgi:hypothetical protein
VADFDKTETPSIWARIFGYRYEDLDGCIVLMWRGKTWERNPGADDRWERTR